MVSTVKVDVVAPRVATGTTTLGVSGDKLLVPSGVTITNSGTASGFAAGFSKYTVVTASDATFDLQSGTTKLIIEVQASGGHAGNTDSNVYRGGAGGAGAYARKFLSNMLDTDKLNITIGAASAIASSGTTTSVASASGTSFTTITCVGGAGGVSGSGSHGSGGAGGTLPTTGDFNFAGGDGSHGSQSLVMSVNGGSFYGIFNYASASYSPSTGPAALGYGSGGSSSNAASGSGTAGGAAVVIVWEYK